MSMHLHRSLSDASLALVHSLEKKPVLHAVLASLPFALRRAWKALGSAFLARAGFLFAIRLASRRRGPNKQEAGYDPVKPTRTHPVGFWPF